MDNLQRVALDLITLEERFNAMSGSGSAAGVSSTVEARVDKLEKLVASNVSTMRDQDQVIAKQEKEIAVCEGRRCSFPTTDHASCRGILFLYHIPLTGVETFQREG